MINIQFSSMRVPYIYMIKILCELLEKKGRGSSSVFATNDATFLESFSYRKCITEPQQYYISISYLLRRIENYNNVIPSFIFKATKIRN